MIIIEDINKLLLEFKPFPPRVKLSFEKSGKIRTKNDKSRFWYIERDQMQVGEFFGTDEDIAQWLHSPFSAMEPEEVKDYGVTSLVLKYYCLLGLKSRKGRSVLEYNNIYGTDFFQQPTDTWTPALIELHQGQTMSGVNRRQCVLGGAWFVQEKERLKALELCGIDRAFQEKCSKYGLGGA